MRSRRAWFAGMLASILACAAGAQATAPQISAAERATLEELACRSRHDVGVESLQVRTYGTGQTTASAEVRCSSHGVYQGSPMHHIVQCARIRDAWECQGDWNEILVKVAGDEIPVRIEGAIPTGVAYLTIQRIANSGTFQGQPLRQALAPPCYLNRGSAQEFIDVKCEGWHIVVSMWCPQSDCPRVFSMTKLGR
ncbi:hypothetical protein [Povalibacter sp.]|uniref:hypothetical protein n=1 Tax=Povalibacter sp. TaxID=1962978 RepID=UPI002F41E026